MNWKRLSLGSVVTLQRGFDLPSRLRVDGPYPIVSSGGITGYHIEATVKGPGVITGRYGSIGEVHYIADDFWPLNTSLWVKDFHGNSPKFVYHLLQTLDFKKFSDKTGVPGVNRNDLHKIIVSCPPRAAQLGIVEILDQWDVAIENMERLIKTKLQIKRVLMTHLLTGSKRLKGFLGSWQPYHLGELFSERCETGHQNIPLLSITGEAGIIHRDNGNRKDSSSEDKSSYLRICPGDIGYNTMRMWQGVSALSSLEGIVSPAYTVCTPKSSVDGQFIAYLFKLPRVINLFYRHSQGLTSDTWNLKFNNFKKIKVTIPDIEEQKAIVKVLLVCDEEIRMLKKNLEAINKQKRGLMQKLLTGEWRVKTAGEVS